MVLVCDILNTPAKAEQLDSQFLIGLAKFMCAWNGSEHLCSLFNIVLRAAEAMFEAACRMLQPEVAGLAEQDRQRLDAALKRVGARAVSNSILRLTRWHSTVAALAGAYCSACNKDTSVPVRAIAVLTGNGHIESRNSHEHDAGQAMQWTMLSLVLCESVDEIPINARSERTADIDTAPIAQRIVAAVIERDALRHAQCSGAASASGGR
eukprot:5489253-Amphidinium_carterae.1